jgi:hypothetical protein
VLNRHSTDAYKERHVTWWTMMPYDEAARGCRGRSDASRLERGD